VPFYFGSTSQLLSFASPCPTGSLFANSAVSGASLVLVVGNSFGMFSATPTSRIAGTSALRSIWVSASSILAKVASGREAASLRVSSEMQSNFVSHGLTFDLPSISSAKLTNFPQSGGTAVTLLGKFFGATDFSDAVYVGSTLCESSAWISDSAFRCKVSSGQYGPTPTGILVQHSTGLQLQRSKTLSHVLSYNLPTLVDVYDSNAPATGFSVSFVMGRSLNHVSAKIAQLTAYLILRAIIFVTKQQP
jgi:hypothetical protein